MVRGFSLFKKIYNVNFFEQRPGYFRPAGGDISRQTRDCRMQVSTGRFAGFAHVGLFVVQTPTA
jgi:hypothetical protein